MLKYLVARPGVLVEKRELLSALWPGVVVEDAALTVCIHELRQVLGDDSRNPRYIETQYRRGYRFIASVARIPSDDEQPASG